MNKIVTTLPLAAIVFCLASRSADSALTIRVNAGAAVSPLQKYALDEFQSYAQKMFSDPIKVSGEAGDFQFAIGTPSTNNMVKKAIDAGRLSLPAGKNFDQGYAVKTIDGAIYVAGTTDAGVLYGVYALLEEYGAYFQIDGERLPPKTAFRVKNLDVAANPVFKYRALLPWDNFLCGMSGWNLEHYQEFIDRAARMKFNMLQFHFYPGLAFFTETWNGKPVDPTFLGSPVDAFKTKGSIGESVFGGEEIFGAKPYVDNLGKPRAQAEACQEMMRRVLDYAHTRGFKTCVGFELMSPTGGDFSMVVRAPGVIFINPLDPENVKKSVERYRMLVKTYPKSDFYWLWQGEGGGALDQNHGHEPGIDEMRKKYSRWSDIGINGNIDYAYHFREVANRLTPEERSKLATGGWFIEHLFPNIDSDFPKEVIFASLNHYSLPRSVPSYKVAQDGRRAWMIEWSEFDGGEWFPQFRVGGQENMYKECADFGVECVSLLGWKLSGIEHNVRYLSEFSWNPTLGADAFYRNYVRRVYGDGSQSIANVYGDNDAIETITPCGYVGGNLSILMHFSNGWSCYPPPELPATVEGLKNAEWQKKVAAVGGHVKQLQILRAVEVKSVAALRETMPKLDAFGRSQAELFTNRFEVRIRYLDVLLALNETLVAYDAVAAKEGIAKARLAAAKPAGKAADQMREAIEQYAKVIRNRGDQGVVAQMNEQFYQPIKKFAEDLGKTGSAGNDK
jgi:hypothetical protein